jgi:hypothetical protein
MVVLIGNVAVFFFNLRNGERLKVKEKRPVRLVVHRPMTDTCTVAFPI